MLLRVPRGARWSHGVPLERPGDDLRQGVTDGTGRVPLQRRSPGGSGRLQRRVEELVEAAPLDHANRSELAAVGEIDVDAERRGSMLDVCDRHGDDPDPHRTRCHSPHLRRFAESVEPSGAHRVAVEGCSGVTDRCQESDSPLAGLAFCDVRKGVVGDLDERPARVVPDQLGAHRAGPQHLWLHSRRRRSDQPAHRRL